MDYRIDDLASAAGTTSRNVRAYQERGLLIPPTRREGRAAIYDDSHLARLRVIDALHDRGFTTAHIAAFFTSWDTGRDLTDVLGLADTASAGWGRGDALEVPRELVDALLGSADADLLDRLDVLGLIRRAGELIEFPVPELLAVFGELHGYGLQLRELLDVYTRIVRHVDQIAELMVDALRTHLVSRGGTIATPELLGQLRELGATAVHQTLERAIDRELHCGHADA